MGKTGRGTCLWVESDEFTSSKLSERFLVEMSNGIWSLGFWEGTRSWGLNLGVAGTVLDELI